MVRTCPTLVQRARVYPTRVPLAPLPLFLFTLGSRSVLIYKALKETQLAGWQLVWGETEETRAQWLGLLYGTLKTHSHVPPAKHSRCHLRLLSRLAIVIRVFWRAHFASDVSGTSVMSWKCCLTSGCEEVKLSSSCSSWLSTPSSLSMIVWGSMERHSWLTNE